MAVAESIFRTQGDIGVCIDFILEYSGSTGDRSSLQVTLGDSKSNVAILVMSLTAAEEMVTSIEIDRHLTFIVIDTYSSAVSSANLPPELNGALIISTNRVTQDFDGYLASLEAGQNSVNPWFDEFIADKFSCALSGSNSRRCGSSDRIRDSSASINANYVIDGVYALARGIDTVRNAMCGTASEVAGFCKAFFEATPEEVKDYVANLAFQSDGRRLVTMRNGSAVVDFIVWNSNKNGDVKMV